MLMTVLTILPASKGFYEAGAQTVLCPQQAPINISFNSVTVYRQQGDP